MKETEKILQEMREGIEQRKARSAWSKGVKDFAIDMMQRLNESVRDGWTDFEKIKTVKDLENACLNGAQDWKQASWGGSWLIYDCDIAKALCNPSELKKTDNGNKKPNASEEWLDVQARALWQAFHMILEEFTLARF